MSREKRPAADAFGTSQLVKRAKSDANLGGSNAVAVVNGSAQNGALVRSVCYYLEGLCARVAKKRNALTDTIGTSRWRAAVAGDGIDWTFWRGLCRTI